jgi:hypothetical protein
LSLLPLIFLVSRRSSGRIIASISGLYTRRFSARSDQLVVHGRVTSARS